MTYQKVYRDDLLVINVSNVREKNAPIMGMQGRPSSGPVPVMNALEKIAKIKGAGMKPWKQALYVDHYLAA
jgi:ribonucleoside-triphosphate reductase (formate)